MKMVLFEPRLSSSNVAPNGGPRGAQLHLQISQLNGLRSPVQERSQGPQLAVGRIEDLWPGGWIKGGQDRPSLFLLAGDPDPQPAAPDDLEAGRAEIRFDERQVVADDPRSQLELGGDRLGARRPVAREEEASDAGLSTIEG